MRTMSARERAELIIHRLEAALRAAGIQIPENTGPELRELVGLIIEAAVESAMEEVEERRNRELSAEHEYQ